MSRETYQNINEPAAVHLYLIGKQQDRGKADRPAFERRISGSKTRSAQRKPSPALLHQFAIELPERLSGSETARFVKPCALNGS